MGLIFRSKKEIEAYISANQNIDIKTIALSSLEYLLRIEKLSVNDISKLFCANIDEVKELLERNGLL